MVEKKDMLTSKTASKIGIIWNICTVLLFAILAFILPSGSTENEEICYYVALILLFATLLISNILYWILVVAIAKIEKDFANK